MLEKLGFLCQCSECSLEGEDLEDNEKIRAEIREKQEKSLQLLRVEGSAEIKRKSIKKAMKLENQRVNLIKNLNLRAEFVGGMITFYQAAKGAREMGITCENDPDIYKQEALKYAKIFGDNFIYIYNKLCNN